MFIIKSGVAALALTFLVASPAIAQDHGMSGRATTQTAMPMSHNTQMMHRMHMSRADTRMMARCHKMSRRAMMRSRSCMRVMAMQKRMDHRMDHRGGNM